MEKVAYLLTAICIILIFVIDVLYYQQPAGRILICVLGFIVLLSALILSYLDKDNEYEEDEEL